MTRLPAQYCSINRILLLILGLWPYQQSKFTRFQFIFFYAILSGGIIFQLTPLITLTCTSDLIIKVLSSVTFFAIFIIKYNAFCLNIGAVKNFLVKLQHIHNELKDENEIAIAEKYSCIAKRYTIVLTVVGVCLGFTIIIVQIWSNIVDVNLPMNASEPYYLIITEYFIDRQKYFYLILLHINAVFCFGIVTLLGTGTMLISYVEHACGMLKIASYRIQHAINIDILQNITLKNKTLMTESIICAVNIHRQAMKLTKHLMSKFEIMVFCVTGCIIICFSLNLFQIFQIAASKNNIKEFLLPIVYALTSFLYMFIANYIGQSIINHNNHIFVTAYNIQWYRTPLHVQRMILFLLQRRSKEFTLSVSGLFYGSIENFATLVKASVSYFTVIYSTHS
ncbi:uncharacterized protein [Temnothorax nylanderi]|uniref:uncharacterized protein n=1 Tax=Temnothorax nylanderi TaxID=102681 RepID=UPI003A83C7CA